MELRLCGGSLGYMGGGGSAGMEAMGELLKLLLGADMMGGGC